MQGGMAQAKGVDGEAPARIGRQKRRNRLGRGWQHRPAVRGAPAGKAATADWPQLAACHER